MTDQNACVITGLVTDADGNPVNSAIVRIVEVELGSSSNADGSYRLVIPAAKIQAGQQVTLTVSRQGLATQSRKVTVNPGAHLTENFQLGPSAV